MIDKRARNTDRVAALWGFILATVAIDLAADMNPREQDDPVILASLVHSPRLNQVVAPDGGPATPADIAGARVGLMRRTNAEFAWTLFAAFHGIDTTTADIVDTRIEDLPDALENGRMDAAVLREPWTSRLRARAGDRLTAFAGSNIYTAKWVLVTRRELAGRDLWTEFPTMIGSPIAEACRRAMWDRVTVAREEFFEPLEAWLDIRAYPSDGGVAIYFRDVTKRHEMETRLRTREEELRVSRDELASTLATRQLLINALPAHIALVDGAGTVLDVNEQPSSCIWTLPSGNWRNRNSIASPIRMR